MTRMFKTEYSLLAATLLLMGAPQMASAESSSLSGLFACDALTAPDAQLSCFRAETAKLRAGGVMVAPQETLTTPQPAVPETAAPLPPQSAAKASEQEFAPLAKEKAKSAKSQTVAIRNTSKTAKGYTRFTLENGEVWEQIESARVRLGKSETDVLTIKRKSFGSFLATVNGKRPSFKVRRVE